MMDAKTLILVLILIIAIFIGFRIAQSGSPATSEKNQSLLGILGVVIGLYAAWLYSRSHKTSEGFLDIPYNHGLRMLSDDYVSDVDLPDDIQDIYLYENIANDHSVRNRDAYPYTTDRHGPRLGPQWAIDNSDVVEDVMSYSRGLYSYDPLFPCSGQFKNYNHEALDADDGLARRQEYRSLINKKAVDGRVRSTKDIYSKYFAAEFDEEPRHEWWGGEYVVDSELVPF